jgi:D-alanyl-D-alanine carboxypeptidase
MKWILSSTFVVAFLVSTSYADTRYNFPQLALGGGYEAVVLITNRANHSWTGSFRPCQGFNSPWQGRWAVNGQDMTNKSSFAITISNMQSVKYRFTGDPSATRSGYLDIDQSSGDSGDASDIVLSYFYEYRNGDGSLADTVGGPITPSFGAGGSGWGFTVEKSRTVSTGLAWCPTVRSANMSTTFNVSLTLYNESGAIVEQKRVTANGHQAQFFDQIFTGLPENFLGYLSIQSSIDIYMIALRYETTSTGFQLTSTPPWHQPAPNPDDLTGMLEPIRQLNHLPALSAAVFYGDTLRAIGTVGVRKFGDPTPATNNDKWHLGSDTKAMTATLAMLIAKEGKISLSTRLADAFPQWASTMDPAYRNVTLKLLLEHRGGVPDTIPSDIWSYMWNATGTSKDVRRNAVEKMLIRGPAVTPDTQYLYANMGYVIVGAALEQVTGIGWEQLIADRLFVPLGMNSCGFGAPATMGLVDQPYGHIIQNSSTIPIDPSPYGDNPPSIGPAGTVHCSLADWGKFVAMHMQGARGEPTRLLSVDDFTALHTPVQDYALGWIVVNRSWGGGDGTVYTHSGSNTMFMTNVWVAPAKNAFMLVATNIADTINNSTFIALDSVFGQLIPRYLF